MTSRIANLGIRCVIAGALLLVASVVHAAGLDSFFHTQKAKYVIVFVDASKSVRDEDWRTYREAYERLLESRLPNPSFIQPGDRVALATISDQSFTGFRPIKDEELQDTGIKMRDERANQQARRALRGAFDQIARRATRTQIMDALLAAQHAFQQDAKHERHIVVLLSDMLEDSDEVKFERQRLDEKATKEIIERRKAKKTFPNLTGVTVLVGGATAATTDKYTEVEAFWKRFLDEAGATHEPGMYARNMPRLPAP